MGYSPLNAENNRDVTNDVMFAYAHEQRNWSFGSGEDNEYLGFSIRRILAGSIIFIFNLPLY